MAEEPLSIADRWIREYEANHPKHTRAIRQQIQLLGPLQFSSDTALPPEIPGSARLWHTSKADSGPELCPVVQSAIATRKVLKLTQAGFSRCLGISPRTLRDWEQGRRQPSGAALTLLTWAVKRPELIRQLHSAQEAGV